MRLMAVLGTVGISFSAIFVRLADVSPTTASLFRTAYAVPVLLLLLLLKREGLGPLRPLAWVAGGVFALNLSVWHVSIEFIGTGLATVLGNTQVIFIALLGWLILGERPTTRALILLPVLIVGVALLSGFGGQAYGANPLLGVLFGVASGLTSGAYVLLFRAASRRFAGRGGAAGFLLHASLSAALASLLLGALFDPALALQPTWPAHGWLFLLALVAQVLGWLLLGGALRALPALETAILMLLQPVLAVLWGGLLFGEQPSSVQWLGVGVLLVGIALLNLIRSIRPARPSVPPLLERNRS